MKKFFNVLTYMFTFLALQAVTGLLARWLLPLITGNPDITASQLLTVQAVSGVITLLIFHFAKWFTADRGYLSSRPRMALLWSGMAAAGMIIPAEWIMEHMPELPNIAAKQFNILMTSPEGYLVVGLFAPIVEEVVFRGAILRTLLEGGSNHWLMIAISALVFSIAHFNPAQMPYTFVAGLLLGWMYYRTGSIMPGMVFHWVNNSVAFAVAFAVKNPDAKLTELFGSNALLAVCFSLLILVPSLIQLNIWLNDDYRKNGSR